MSLKKVVLTTLSCALFAAPLAQADRAEDAIEYRQGIFKAYGWHFGAMGAMVRGKVDYDAEQFAHHAKSFLAVAPLAAEGFVEGSDFGDTSAKDELWENLDDVNQRFVAMTEAAEKLVAASGGELSDAKAAFGAVAKSCKGCHDNYREKR
ncbi:MAG: c-type cytochrome [Marinobacterium sp.]